MAGETRRRRLRALLARTRVGSIPLERLDAAFVHESAAAEHAEAAHGLRSNERLEFLGDAVLGLVTAEWLFDRYADAPEGDLAVRKAYLVSEPALAQTARRLQLGELLILGNGAAEAADGDATLADALEALIAVVHRERGLERARSFVVEQHLAHLGDAADRAQAVIDPKTALQELTQRVLRALPRYEDSGEGPDHRRTYNSRVIVAGEVLGAGTGSSKKSAQRAAAAAALASFEGRRAARSPGGGATTAVAAARASEDRVAASDGALNSGAPAADRSKRSANRSARRRRRDDGDDRGLGPSPSSVGTPAPPASQPPITPSSGPPRAGSSAASSSATPAGS